MLSKRELWVGRADFILDFVLLAISTILVEGASDVRERCESFCELEDPAAALLNDCPDALDRQYSAPQVLLTILWMCELASFNEILRILRDSPGLKLFDLFRDEHFHVVHSRTFVFEFLFTGFTSVLLTIMSEAKPNECTECGYGSCSVKPLAVVVIIIGFGKVAYGALVALHALCCGSKKIEVGRCLLCKQLFLGLGYVAIAFPLFAYRVYKLTCAEKKEVAPAAQDDGVQPQQLHSKVGDDGVGDDGGRDPSASSTPMQP